MSEHYTKNTRAVSKFCLTCGKMTMHRVDFKRVGSCMEHQATGMSKAQEKRLKEQQEREENPTLF